MEDLFEEFQTKDKEIQNGFENRFGALYQSMYSYIDKLKKPDSELLNLTYQSKNTTNPKVKRDLEKLIDKKIDKLKEKRLYEFKTQVSLEKDKLKKLEEKDRRNLKIDTDSKLNYVTSKQTMDFDKLINRYRNIKLK